MGYIKQQFSKQKLIIELKWVQAILYWVQTDLNNFELQVYSINLIYKGLCLGST